MGKLVDVRVAANEEKRDMLKRGTPYRKTTAVYTSRLVNDLVSSGYSKNLSKEDLAKIVKAKYNVNDDRVDDVVKSVLVHHTRVNDKERLAKYYEKADALMSMQIKNSAGK